MKVLIINYNRLTLSVKLANWCAEHGLEPVFVDNHSDYAPLLEYYRNCPYKVLRLDKNYGHTVVWLPEAKVLRRLRIKGRYIVTDPDLDLSGIPDDFLSVLETGLKRFPRFLKCGFSLEVKDLPNTKSANIVKRICELRFWRHPLDTQYFRAAIDTTFALYRENVKRYSLSAIRTNRPYTARHLPWYYDRLRDLPADEQYYYETANASASGNERIRR